MKITNITLTELQGIGPVVIAAGLPDYYYPLIMMSVETDEGITGHCFNWYYNMEQMKGGLDRIRRMAIGKDPFDVNKLCLAIQSDFNSTDIPVSVFDICLYDIIGQKLNTPVYNLLGGKIKDTMPAYVSTVCYSTVEEYIEKCQWAADHNFIGYKLHTSPNADMDIEVCAKLRERFPHMHLMIDACGNYDMHDAYRVGKAIEKLNFEWYESPLPDDDIDGMKRLGSSLSIPISYGENIRSIARNVGKYLKERPGDILRTFGDFHGGITMLQRVAHCADAFGIKFDPHSYGPTLVQAAHFHVMLAHKSSWWFELPINYEQFNVGMKDVILPDKNGLVHAPTKPGLGYDLDMDYIKEHTIAYWG